MRPLIALLTTLAALAVAGCGSMTHATSSSTGSTAVEQPSTGPTSAEQARQEKEQAAFEHKEAVKKAAAEAKHKAKVRAYGEEQVRLLHQEEREGKIEKAIPPAQAEAEYNRRNAEGEQKLKEMERRARGELTPEEQKDQEASKNEASTEAEAIREGERLKSEGK